MIVAAFPVLAASLVGSVHCAAMCGTFACVAVDGAPRRDADHARRPAIKAHAMYNVGRLAAYAMLGAIAGQVGAHVTHMAAWVGIARGATILAGALMVLWALDSITRARGRRSHSMRAPLVWQRTVGSLLRVAQGWHLMLRAGVTGLLTGLIPCGWLYVFVTTAAATGSPQSGAMVMSIFWLGTLPALIAVGIGAQRILSPLQSRLPQLSASVVLVMGILAISGRMSFAHVH